MQPTDNGRGLPRQGDPEARPGDEKPRRGGRLRLRNWRVPQRLIALILIPTAVAVALGGLRITTGVNDTQAFGRVEKLADLGKSLATLVQEFALERDLSAGFIAAGRSGGTTRENLNAEYAKVDTAAQQVRALARDIDASYGSEVAADAVAIQNRLDGIKSLRATAESKAPAGTVIDKYSESISELLGFFDDVAQAAGDENLAQQARALGAVSRIKEQASEQRGLLYSGLITGNLDPDEADALIAARTQEASETATFRTLATLEQRRDFEDTVTGPEVDRAREYRQRALAVIQDGGQAGATRLDIDPASTRDAVNWWNDMSGTIDKMRAVEQRLADTLIANSKERKQDARTTAILDGAVVAIVLLLVLLVTFIVARSLVRPLRRLRAGALEIAGTRLPGLVERLRDPSAAASGIDVHPIDIDSTDEIGQVARAFDEVHREAVRLASDEAVLRGNINTMFVNLSRRSQSLVERQLRLIDELEQGERDEERLAALFRLDHLATRMRRNSENLLVLGGADQVRRWNQPVPLIDIVRAALSEVEQYERVGLRVQGEVSVLGPAVNDLVHLVAELVENATSFSPDHTKVTVSGHLLSGGGAMLQITDNGFGMSQEELESANWRLANPPVIDFSAARRMGLFVVGRLAVRHGIRVELRPALSGGLTAFVLMPGALITQGEGAGMAPRRFDGAPEDPMVGAGGLPGGMDGMAGAVAEPMMPAPLAAHPAPTLHPPAPRQPIAPPPVPQQPGAPQPVAQQPMAPPPSGPPAYGRPQFQGRHTGPQPGVGRQTGPLPAFRGDSAGPPSMSRHSGNTGPQQPPRDSGAQRIPPRVPPADPPPGELPGFAQPGAQSMPSWPEAGAGGAGTGPGSPWASNETGPQPAVQPARPERSPIFDAMESEWFHRRAVRSGEKRSAPPAWESPADQGFQAAEVVREPAAGGVTSAGLPKRVPGRNRVPGSVGGNASRAAQPQQPVPTQAPPPTPAQTQPASVVRDRFASLQRGTHRARSQVQSGEITGELPSLDDGETGGSA